MAKVSQLEKQNTVLRASNESKGKHVLQLRMALDREKTLATFTTFGNADQTDLAVHAPDDFGINQTLNHVNYCIRQAVFATPCSDEKLNLQSVLETHKQHAELLCLLRSCFNVGDLGKSRNLHFSAHDLLRMAVWAAIRDWIFYSDLLSPSNMFPLFDSFNRCIYDRGKAVKYSSDNVLILDRWTRCTAQPAPRR